MGLSLFKKEHDFVAIGDTVIDAFIRLKDAEVHCDIDNVNCKLSVRFGEKIPFESVDICNAVGNAANAAVSASRLGLSSALLTRLGKDQNGEDCLKELKKNGVDTSLIKMEAGKKTNYHYVLWYDVDRTILVKHEKFNYSLEGLGNPKWIYLSSLGDNSLPVYEALDKYLAAHPKINLAFQPGVFDMKLGLEKLSHIYSRATSICVNVEEAQKVLNIQERDVKQLLKKFSDLGPKYVFITDGIEGAYAYEKAKDEYWKMPVYPHEPVERTGAGDAFFSTVTSALSMGKTLEEALRWGPINSMSVVQKIGAQEGLLTQEKLKDYLRKAPAEYKPTKI